MNVAPLEKIADAVLYEGYLLYPYRSSSLKNRQRWNFGTLYPRSFAEQPSSGESFSFQAEVLVQGNAGSRLSVRVRFLQLLAGRSDEGQERSEGVIQAETLDGIPLSELAAGVARPFAFAAPRVDGLRTGANPDTLTGRVTLHCVLLREGAWRLQAVFSNETALPASERASAKAAQRLAFVSAHALLEIEEGTFVSLLDPPADLASDAAACANRGIFPVLAGDAAHMLASPIILYDNPQVAPESAGDFFDGTEMDEMLALRVLTLTDEEKAEMRQGDRHAAAILQRTETLPAEQLLKLHGVVRGLRPVVAGEQQEAHGRIEPWNPFEEDKPPLESVRVFDVDLRCGDRVRLWPDKQADILDIAMKGKTAVIEAIEQDLEGNVQLAVVLEDDPGRDMGLLRQAGHRFFFSPDEIEPLPMEAP
ncbi:MAG TPA: hypothetical protein VHU89_03825 [Acidobacteriaceae bacterium]|jgi:hypothetical protein|nr:hypothetical protein [Acidobacteriaceae bacterium]